MAANTDYSVVEAIFGPELVRERLLARLEYTTRRVVLSAPMNERFIQHVETAQWLDYFCENTLSIERQLAQAYGKSLFPLFVMRPVVSSALAVPVTKRYFRGPLDVKHLLKRVLKKRLPKYPINQRKCATGLPFDRYYTAGPLSDIWTRYRMPDFIEGKIRERVTDHPSQVTWNAITYAIWEYRVVRNPHLKPVPSTFTSTWTF